jgi:hypothetical protein
MHPANIGLHCHCHCMGSLLGFGLTSLLVDPDVETHISEGFIQSEYRLIYHVFLALSNPDGVPQ